MTQIKISAEPGVPQILATREVDAPPEQVRQPAHRSW